MTVSKKLISISLLSFLFVACQEQFPGDFLPATGESYTVTFETNSPECVIPPQVVTEGESIIEPVKPVLSGYAFSGWYESNERFNFSTSIHADTTLQARWTPIQYSVWFIINGNNIQNFSFGNGITFNSVTDPFDPQKTIKLVTASGTINTELQNPSVSYAYRGGVSPCGWHLDGYSTIFQNTYSVKPSHATIDANGDGYKDTICLYMVYTNLSDFQKYGMNRTGNYVILSTLPETP